jgi:hypothetical protein
MGELEDLKKLPPGERLKRLKELEQKRKKEEAESKRISQESEAEIRQEENKKIREILEEAEAELKIEKKKASEKPVEGKDLEERVAQDKIQQQDGGPQYKHTFSEINELASQQDTLNQLTYKESWDEEDQELYHEAKENIAAATYLAQKYSTDVAGEVVDTLLESRKALESMGYKRRKWTED